MAWVARVDADGEEDVRLGSMLRRAAGQGGTGAVLFESVAEQCQGQRQPPVGGVIAPPMLCPKVDLAVSELSVIYFVFEAVFGHHELIS
jgi:hypothetical protein